jgi:hypothetical protein
MLSQCMDVTLSDQYTLPSNITCMETAGQPPTNTTSSPPPTSTKSSGAISVTSNWFLGLSLAGMLVAGFA